MPVRLECNVRGDGVSERVPHPAAGKRFGKRSLSGPHLQLGTSVVQSR